MRFRRRASSPRMPSFDYVGGYIYHVVATTKDRQPFFSRRELTAKCVDDLEGSAKRHSFEVHAYCFMPNHVHLLIEGNEGAELVRFMQNFKQKTGHRRPGLWQRSYYDHVMRLPEEIENVALYVWSNPVVAGLCDDPLEYAFSGPRDRLEGYVCATSAEDRAKALSLQAEQAPEATGQRHRSPTAEDRAKALSLQAESNAVAQVER